MTPPQCMPKTSIQYLRWHFKLVMGQEEGRKPVFDPRTCVVDGQTFTPKVGNQKRCPDCIAAGRTA